MRRVVSVVPPELPRPLPSHSPPAPPSRSVSFVPLDYVLSVEKKFPQRLRARERHDEEGRERVSDRITRRIGLWQQRGARRATRRRRENRGTGERRGNDEEIGFALQSRWSAIMGHSVGASTRALIRYELSNYIITRDPAASSARRPAPRVAPAGSLSTRPPLRSVFRFSRGTKFSGRLDAM